MKLSLAAALLLIPPTVLHAEYPQVEQPYPANGYEWENNTLGMDQVVPAPWTALRFDGEAVECWGRRFVFGKGALPLQITSQGHELFASAPKIVLRVDGHDVDLDGDGVARRTLSAPHKMMRTWETSSGAHRVQVVTSLEYDGFCHVSLRIEPKDAAKIERLTLEFPLPREQAAFFNRFEDYDFDAQRVNHDDLLASAGRVNGPVNMRFNPCVWIGNHNVGVEWSCEVNAGWSPMKSEQAIQITPHGDHTTLAINVVAEPRRVDSPFELNFALMPTPVKPRPADWRRYRLTTAMPETAGYSKEDHVFGFAMGLPTKFRGLPLYEPRASGGGSAKGVRNATQEIQRLRDQAAANGAGFIPYGALYGMPGLLPHEAWKDYASAWRVNLTGGSVVNKTWAASLGLPAGAESLIYVCPSERSFQDFLVWHYTQAIEKHELNGIYFDVAAPNYPCTNPNHHHAGPREDGWLYYPFFSQRRFMQRLYVACRARDPNFLITQHIAMQPAVCSGFTDVVIKGEALNRTFRQKHFSYDNANTDATAYVPDYGKLPADYFALHFTPNQGPVLMLLPQVVKWNDELMRKDDALRKKFTRTMLARTAIADVPVMKSHADNELCNRLERAQVRSGISDGATFHGPWEAASYVTSSGHELKYGLYFKTKNHGLAMVVANTTDGAAKETLTLNRDALKAANVQPGEKVTLINVFTSEETNVPGNSPITLDLDPNELRMIAWE